MRDLTGLAWIGAALVGLVPAPLLLAQTPPPAAPAAVIDAAEMARYLGALTADSLIGPGARGHELDARARYVADQFSRLGLRPNGDQGTWFQRYTVPGQLRLDYAKSTASFGVAFARGGKTVVAEDGNETGRRVTTTFADGVRYLGQSRVGPFWSGAHPPAVLLAGRHTAASVRQAAVHDRVAIYVPPADADSVARQQVIDALRAATSWVIVADDRDSAAFATATRDAQRQPLAVVDEYATGAVRQGKWPWTIAVRQSVLADYIGALGFDLARLRLAAVPTTQLLPDADIWVVAQPASPGHELATAPNVVGLLEGSDAALKNQYVVISAHIGDVDGGDPSSRADSAPVEPGRDAVRAAGLIALAQAFGRSHPRPRRSVIFLAASGGKSDDGGAPWGSDYFAHASGPLQGQTAVNLTIDVVGAERGHRTADTVLIDGLAEVEFPTAPIWVAAEHPELGLTVVDGGTAFHSGTDCFAFAGRGTPSVCLHPADGPNTPRVRERALAARDVDPARTARMLDFAFYLGQTIADAEPRSRWSAEGRRQVAAFTDP